MGKVAVTFRIMPEGVEVDLDNITLGIKKYVDQKNLAKVEQKPIAFGLKFLEVIVVMDDKSNNSVRLEEKFKELDGVQSVEITDVCLL